MNAPDDVVGIVRASSWSTLFDCSLRWYYHNVMNMRTPSRGATQLGTALHKATAVYDTPRVTGQSPNLTEACDALAESIAKPDGEIVWDDDLRPDVATEIGVALTHKYASDIAPSHDFRAVEVKCEALDVSTEHGVVRLSGTTDRVRITNDGREGISDIKSGSRAVAADGKANTKGRHLQTGIYKLMAENTLERALEAPDEIIGLNTGKTAIAQRVGTGEIRDSRTPLVGYDEVPGLIELAARMLKSGTFPPNPQSTLCSPKYCGGYHKCQFHD